MTALEEQVARLADTLLGRGWMLVTAESCTGGGIAAALTERPGSSAWFERGYVTYSNAAKCELLGVQLATLERQGAVSEAVAQEMAVGALAQSHAQLAVSVTGIAGPDGGTLAKPVGTVCFAWAVQGQPCRTETRDFAGDRQAIRLQACIHALAGALQALERAPPSV
ncbi:MAG: CinA family protein [Burkholderiaceae bacterium]|nr:MAG: CinA family protein [Burkholderiaceae bacterium]